MIKKIHTLDSKEVYKGFTKLNLLTLQNEFDDGSYGQPYSAEQQIIRSPIVMCILYGWPTLSEKPTKHNCTIALRKQIRPVFSINQPYQIEIVGGCSEQNETILMTAIREAKEEYGLDIAQTVYKLGDYPLLPSPGISTEQVYFTAAEISAEQFKEIPTIRPSGDGHQLEAGSILFTKRLADVINDCRNGLISCMKVEIAARRLWDYI